MNDKTPNLNTVQRDNFAASFDTLSEAEEATRKNVTPFASLRQQGISIEYCGGLLLSYAIVQDYGEDGYPDLWRVDSVWVKTRLGREVACMQRSPMRRAIAALDGES